MARIKIEGLKVGTQYKFYAVAVGPDGIESAPSGIYTFTTNGDTTAPDPISNLQTDFNTTTMSASWNGPDISNTPDFLDYKIIVTKPSSTSSQTFYTSNKSFSLSLEQNRNLFGISTPSPSVTISISSRDTSGNLSAASSTVAVNPVPSSVSSASADFLGKDLLVKWTPVSGTTDTDTTGYQVTLYNSTAGKTIVYPVVGKDANAFNLSFEQNTKDFSGTARPTFNASISAIDIFGQLSSTPYASVLVNPAPTESPSITTTSILRGFSASWAAVGSSFTDYSYTEVYYSDDPLFATSVKVWTGNGTYMEYAGFGLYNPIYIRARHIDVFNQAGPYGNTGSITPTAPVQVDTVPPSNATGLNVTASNSGGANGMSGYIIARWNESVDSTLRGARLRFRAQGDQSYQYENLAASVSGTGSYQIGNLIPGFVYEVAIASYDEINNTSSFTLASPSAILIPFGVPQSEATSASAAANSSTIALAATVSGSMIGQVIAGYGLVSGTRITGSATGSVTITPNTASAFSGSTVSLYKGMANWQSYVTAGASMKFGTGVNGTQHGIWLDNNNYWYTTGNLRVGSNTSYLGWDGQTASITGDITAKSGSFDGNVFITSLGSLVAASTLTGARVILNRNGIIAYNSAGTNTFVVDAGTGNIGASAGIIGGWNITSASLYAGTAQTTVGLAVNQNSGGISIWAGSSTPSLAPFRVTNTGNASFTNAYVSGSIVASTGSIGSWYIGASGLYAGAAQSDTNLSASIVRPVPIATASPTILNLGNLLYLRAAGQTTKPQIYINNVTDSTNYSNINLNVVSPDATYADGALELYRRFNLANVTATISTAKYDPLTTTASLFTSTNPTTAGLRVGNQLTLTGFPEATKFTATVANVSDHVSILNASFSGTTACWSGGTDSSSANVLSGDYVLTPLGGAVTYVSGSGVTISNITFVPVYDSGSYVTEYYTGTLSLPVTTASRGVTASFVSPTKFSVRSSTLGIEVGDQISFTGSVAKSFAASYTPVLNASVVNISTLTGIAPAASAIGGTGATGGAITLTLTQSPNFADFNSNNPRNTSGSVYYQINTIVETTSTGSYITISKYPSNFDGLTIVSGSQTGLSGTATSRKQFSGGITTSPFYAQDGHLLYFYHDKGTDGTSSSAGWPERLDYNTSTTATRIIQPNILTRAGLGTIEMNGTWMSDGISKMILGDGTNNYGAELTSWYDTYVGSLIARISMFGTYSQYSSFWTGSSIKAGRPGIQFQSSQGKYAVTSALSTSSVASTAGQNWLVVASSGSTSWPVGAEIINTANTSASGIGGENQIESITNNATAGTASVFLSYSFTATVPASTPVSVYSPDRRKMEFNSSGNIYMQSEEDITFQATRFFSVNNATIIIKRNPSLVYFDAAKYTMGNGYFKSGIDIEPQTSWLNSASPYIMITPFDNYGSRITTNVLSYNHAQQSWMFGDKTNAYGNQIKLKVESTGVGAGNAGIKIGRRDGTYGLSYIDFHSNTRTDRDYDTRIISSSGGAGNAQGILSLNAAVVQVTGNSANQTSFNSNGTASGTANSWAASWNRTTGTLTSGAFPNSSASCSWKQIGKTVFAKYKIVISKTASGTGSVMYVSLPVNGDFSDPELGGMLGEGYYNQAATYYPVWPQGYSSTNFRFLHQMGNNIGTSSANNLLTLVGGSAPTDCAQGDVIFCNIQYQAANYQFI